MHRRPLLSLLLVVLASCTAGRPVVGPQPGKAAPSGLSVVSPEDRARMEAEYTTLVEKIRRSPQPEDVKRLREVYVRTDRYQPYGADGFPPQDMFDALDQKRWEDCRASAARTLDRNYTSLYAHLGAMLCEEADNRRTEAAQHEAVIKQLLDAIRATGDGKSTATAFVTYYTPELRAFLQFQGLEILGQALSDDDGEWFDIMSVKDRKTGKEFSVTFNITWQWMKQALDDGAAAGN